MRALILLIIVIPLLVTTASATEKNLFFCQDTFGNLTGEKRDFVLSVGIEKIKMSFINKGEQFVIVIPDRWREGHEAHFAAVTRRFIKYFKKQKLPTWEVTNMLSKYHLTTTALKQAHSNR